ncbi:MAG: hypothetical protein LUH14_05855 [Clostridiaceae bacterium]|nr:hypothetical protein [Clostridiaceae bacterium]
MAKKTQEIIEIRPIDLQKVTIHVEGDTPLIMHKWSEKARKQMIGIQTGTDKGKKKEAKNPFKDFVDSAYFFDDPRKFPEAAAAAEEALNAEDYDEFYAACAKGARFGFPTTGFKQAAISAAYRMGWAKDKMSLRGAFFIEADCGDLVEIKSDIPVMREDSVKIGMGTADLRYRPEFRNWSCDLVVSYNKNGAYSLENIINIINAGGCICGVGEWRVERDGQNGRFHVY